MEDLFDSLGFAEEEPLEEILVEAQKRDSYDALANLTFPPLLPDQSIELLEALINKRFLSIRQTGRGKTFLGTAFIRAVKNSCRGKYKALMIVRKNQKLQTPDKITNMSGLRVKFFTGEDSARFKRKNIVNTDIVMVTQEALNNVKIYEELVNCRNMFNCAVVDEMHLVCNLDGSNSAFSLYCLLQSFEYILGLTATPITTDESQFAMILHMINPVVAYDYRELTSDLKNYRLMALPNEVRNLFRITYDTINNRKGYRLSVPAMKHQVGARGSDMFVTTKGPGATRQAQCVVDLINSRPNQRSLIYCNRKVCQSFLSEYLTEHGISNVVINGDMNKLEDRKFHMEKFAEGEYRTIITNLKEALDLDCEYVLFYEFTVHSTQMIGRADRGFSHKELDVIYMITENTGEFEYFIENVYKISRRIQDMFDISLAEITDTLYVTDFPEVRIEVPEKIDILNLFDGLFED